MALLPANRRDQLLLVACIAALAAIYGYYTYVWSPKGDELALLQTRIDTLEHQNKLDQDDIARGVAAKIKVEAEQYGRMLAVMRQLVPVANEVPTLLDQISTAARR